MRRPKRKHKVNEPNVPIAPMLDMAFQLLTFFVLTYDRAAGGAIRDELAAAAAGHGNGGGTGGEPGCPFQRLAGVRAHLAHHPEGRRWRQPGAIVIEQNEIPNEPKALEDALGKYLQDPDLPFDQTLIKVDPNLRYSELMTVINAFSNAFLKARKDPKLSFVELRPDEGE